MPYKLKWLDKGLYHDAFNSVRLTDSKIKLVVQGLMSAKYKYHVIWLKRYKHQGSMNYDESTKTFKIVIAEWPYGPKRKARLDTMHLGHSGYNLNAHYWATLIHELGHCYSPPWAKHGPLWKKNVELLTKKLMRKFMRVRGNARAKKA